ncbi:MAG: sulfatase [Kiritimatiellales bacterium]|jgi:arylsulfatase A-like enzyme
MKRAKFAYNSEKNSSYYDFMKLAGLGAAALGFPMLGKAAVVKPADRPNVLFIAIDDLRDWVGYLGNTQVKTPNLDRLAARGVYFTRSYCAVPCCNPSRSALLTGLRPSTSGVYGQSHDFRKIAPEGTITLPRYFKDNGYYVAGAGKIFHNGFLSSDWDDYKTGNAGLGNEDDAKSDDNTKNAGKLKEGWDGVGGIEFGALDCADKDMGDYWSVSYILKQLGEPHGKPFFLACGLRKPHMPWSVPKKYYDMYPLDKIKLPKVLPNDLDDVPAAGIAMAQPEGDHAAVLKSGRWKEAVQAYLATITFTDAMVGRLIDGLDKSTCRDNTIICLWSDHGWMLGEKQHWRKFALWEESARAPYMWIVPGVTKPGGVCNRTVDYMQIYPTLCDLAGLPVPKHVEGESIRTLLEKPDAPWDKPALTTWLFNNHTVRSERWRYIRYADGGEELYDHDRDPLEWNNLAQNPEYAPVKADLAKWLPKENKPWPERAPKEPGRKNRKGGKKSSGSAE